MRSTWQSIWAIVGGLVEIGTAFQAGESGGTRAMFIVGGLLTVAFGVVLCARPDIGTLTVALLFGLFTLAYGGWALVHGIELRRTSKELPSVARPREAAEDSFSSDHSSSRRHQSGAARPHQS